MIADASAILEYLLQTETGALIAPHIRDPDVDLHVPALCDVEVLAGLRRAALRRLLGVERAQQVLEDYRDLPLTRHGHRPLLERMFALRQNFSAYDATYVALAEGLSGALLTADEPLGRAAGEHAAIAVVP